MESLTEKVLLYQRTGRGADEILAALAPRVYHFPRRTMGWDEDACGDFYVFVHPRIVRLLARFRDQGKPFESYLWAVLGWQLRNFARERRSRERAWRVTLRVGHQENESDTAPAPLADPGPDGAEGAVGPGLADLLDPSLADALRSRADQRHLLFLLLKCCRAIDAAAVAPLAERAGVTVRFLVDTAAALREMRSGRERRLEVFRARRNRAFALLQLLEAELSAEIDEERRAVLRDRAERARRCIAAAVGRMARVGVAPTNREIAMILGIPKGTVDSGLFWLRRKLTAGSDRPADAA